MVATEDFATRLLVLAGISVLMTVGVYGLVAGIVKLDDAGVFLSAKTGGDGSAAAQRKIGRLILLAAPLLMKTLSILGTAAMFLVGGGILTHGIHAAHDLSHHLAHIAGGLPGVGGVLEAVVPALFDGIFGVLAGAVALLVVGACKKIAGR
jgi:predicted DNA repair protein MutK